MELRGEVPEGIGHGHLNTWLKIYFRAEVLTADEFRRACMGTNLRWDYLTLYWQCRNNFGHDPIKDTFGIGFEGSVEDEIINGVIHCQSLEAFSQLPGDEEFKRRFSGLCRRWDQILAKKVPVVEPTAPVEPVKPVEPPPRPTVPQWWTCPACDEHNPPLRETCLKCRRKRHGSLPDPDEKPDSSGEQKPAKNWRQQLAWLGAIASAVLAGWFLFGAFIPAPVAAIIKVVLQLVVSIFGGS